MIKGGPSEWHTKAICNPDTVQYHAWKLFVVSREENDRLILAFFFFFLLGIVLLVQYITDRLFNFEWRTSVVNNIIFFFLHDVRMHCTATSIELSSFVIDKVASHIWLIG